MGTVPGIRRPTARAQQLRRQATPAERALWPHLARRALGGFKFCRQMPIGPYVCDFMCRSARLVVELDGYSHDLTVEADKERDHFLQGRGFTILRFSNADVLANVEGVCLAILARLAASPTPCPPTSGRGDDP